jgi:hypothetical protein
VLPNGLLIIDPVLGWRNYEPGVIGKSVPER